MDNVTIERLIVDSHNFNEKTLMSNWSHRHLAYAAGIGRFGHHDSLITKKGCPGRLGGSLVIDLELKPTPGDRGEYCLDKAGYKGLKCVGRCQYNALYSQEFDRYAGHKQCQVNDMHHAHLELVDICGKRSAMAPSAPPIQNRR